MRDWSSLIDGLKRTVSALSEFGQTAEETTPSPRPLRTSARLANIVVGNTSMVIVAQAARLAAGIGINAVLSRDLGPAGFGRYSLVFVYVGMVMGIIANWGLGSIAVRDASQNPDQTESILGTATALQFVASAASYAILLIAVRTLAAGQVGFAVGVAGVVLLLMPVDTLGLVLQVHMRLARLALVSIPGALLTLGAVAIAAANGAGVTGFVVATTCATVLRYGLILLILRGELVWPRVRPLWHRCWPMLSEAWPLAVATIFVTLINQAPLVLLERFSTPEQVGYFSAANRVASQLTLLPLALSASLYPLLARAAADSPDALGRYLSHALRLMLIVAMPLALAGIVGGSWLAQLLYGPRFAPAAPAVALLVVEAATLFPGIIAGEAMVALGRQRFNLFVLVGGGLVVIVGCAAISRPFGAVGAAVVLLVGYTVIGGCEIIAISLQFRRHLSLRGWPLSIAGMSLSITTLVAGRYLPSGAALVVACVTYVAVLLLFRGLDGRDLRTLRSLATIRRAEPRAWSAAQR